MRLSDITVIYHWKIQSTSLSKHFGMLDLADTLLNIFKKGLHQRHPNFLTAAEGEFS
jgi:hypothetical protein